NAINDFNTLTHDETGLSPDEKALLADAKYGASTRATGAGVGALGGAAAAYGACAVANQDAWKSLLCALGGAAMGGFAGYAAGDYVAERNRQAAANQADLHAQIEAVDKDIKRYKDANVSASRIIAEQRGQVDKLNAELSAAEITIAQYRSQTKGLEISLASL